MNGLTLLMFILVFFKMDGLKRPTKRPDGSLYFPGRGCGISEPYKTIYELPEDTSDLKCVFYKEKQNSYPRKRKMILRTKNP